MDGGEIEKRVYADRFASTLCDAARDLARRDLAWCAGRADFSRIGQSESGLIARAAIQPKLVERNVALSAELFCPCGGGPGGLNRRRRASQRLSNAMAEVFKIGTGERFADETVEARIQRLLAMLAIDKAGNGDQRRAAETRGMPEMIRQFAPVQPGHRQVDEHHIGVENGRLFQRELAAGCCLRVASESAEQERRAFCGIVVILND